MRKSSTARAKGTALARQKPRRAAPIPDGRPFDVVGPAAISTFRRSSAAAKDFNDQTRDHLDGLVAVWDVPNDCGCQLFTLNCPHAQACADHGMSLELWRTFQEALSPAQFADPPPPPFASTAVTHDGRLNELILRFDAGVGLWDAGDAYQPDNPDAHPHLSQVATTAKDGGLRLEVSFAPAIDEQEVLDEVAADAFADRQSKRTKPKVYSWQQ